MLLNDVMLAVPALVPPLATGRMPVTPVVSGSPVTLVITPEAGVPNAGVTKTGESNVCTPVHVFACPKANEATTAPVVGDIVNVPSELDTDVGMPVREEVVDHVTSPLLSVAVNIYPLTGVLPLIVKPVVRIVPTTSKAFPGLAEPTPIFPVVVKDVAVAAPKTGVTSVGDVENTRLVDVVPVAPDAV